MSKLLRFCVVLLAVTLFAAGCQQREEDDTSPAPESSPSPTPLSFELEGVVVEASGSAAIEDRTTTETERESRPTSTATPTGSTTTVTERFVIERGAPGSLAIRLSSYSSDDRCLFEEGDTLVVLFTADTTFDPDDLVDSENFPNNLDGRRVSVTGLVLDAEDCVLRAEQVVISETAEASPTPTGRVSPSPTGTRRASPTPSPTGSP